MEGKGTSRLHRQWWRESGEYGGHPLRTLSVATTACLGRWREREAYAEWKEKERVFPSRTDNRYSWNAVRNQYTDVTEHREARWGQDDAR